MLLFSLLPRETCRGCFRHVEGQMSLIGERVSQEGAAAVVRGRGRAVH